MSESKIVTGLAINVTELHDKDEYPHLITGFDVNFINIGSQNIPDSHRCFWDFNSDAVRTNLFEYSFKKYKNIALFFLVKFRWEPDQYFPGSYRLKPYKFIRYGTHEYDVVKVMGKSNNGQQLLLFGEKLGQITYDIGLSNYALSEFIRNDDNLLVKFPSKPGQYIKILDNISYQERLYDTKSREFWRPGWALDKWSPVKYRFSPSGILLQNKRIKEKS